MDDLIFSGAGSGCNEDDEDQCTPIFESGSGDDLITPVYVPPTRPPATTPKPGSKVDPDAKPCDDEDCFPGSGSGEVVEESTASSIGSSSGSTGMSGSTGVSGSGATSGSTGGKKLFFCFWKGNFNIFFLQLPT